MQSKLYYLNPSIKKVGLNEEYTREQVEEYIRCSNDVSYFTENYVKIVSLDKGLVPFILRPYQKRLVESYANNKNTITLQPRQGGKTVTTAAFMLWFAIFHPDKTIAILANKAKIAREILDRVIKSLENIPFFLQPGVKVLNKGSVEFGNGSRIFADATSEDAIRGFSVNILYLDEFAHVDNAVKFFESVFPTISSGEDSKIIISSTANGLNLYYKLWKDATDGRNDFVPVEVKLSEIPGRNEEWQRKQIEILGERGFRQEYGNEFLGSSNTLISGYKLQELTWEIPIFRDVETCILAEPEEGHTYVSIVDVSKGVSQDYSTITTIDMNEVPYRTVHTYRDNNIPPIKLPEVVLAIAMKYNNSYILCERNAMGQAVVDSLFYDFDYENIFSTAAGGRKGQTLSLGCGGKFILGVEMSTVVKRIGMATLKAMIEGSKIINFTEDQVLELYNFISKNETFMADKGKHDDLVMNLVLFAWALNQPFFKELSNQDISAAFRDTQPDEYDIVPFGFVADGTEPDDIIKEIWNF